MFNRKFCRASLGLALSAALGAASLTVAQDSGASDYVRGASRFAAGDFVQATVAFDEAIAAKSEDPRVYYFRGLCAARQNDPASAAAFFATGARLELASPKGRLVAVDAALTTIQGAERAMIEAARAQARADWKAQEIARQNALYGESLDRQRARLATPPQTAGAASAKTAPASKTLASQAFSVSGIRPFFRGETSANQAPNLYDPNSDEFNYFREDLGKTSLSTRELKRLAEIASREVYDDPMDRPAADGSPFINIYDSSEVFVEDAPFVGDDDPDVLYAAEEKNALNALATSFRAGALALSLQSGSDAASNGSSSSYGSSSYGYPSDYPGGPGSSGAAAAPVEPSKADDTKTIFPNDEKPVASPFGDKIQLDAENDFDLFQAGRDFKPTAPAPTDPYSSGGPH